MTHGKIPVIAADQELITFRNDIAVTVDTGIGGSLCTAIADRFDLGNSIRYFKEASGTFKQGAEEVRPETETKNGDIVHIHQLPKLVDLRRSHELTFINDNRIYMSLESEAL